jgi:DNA polymerase-1
VLEYRGLKKLLTTYVEALPLLIDKKTGRIHTSFNQAVAATGRLSSNNPNLQNIPVKDERGREIRKAFVPAEGCLFLSADYSQIELRLMAHLSKDKSMISDFLSGNDIHAATAAKIFKVGLKDVTREMRSRAKTANFGIIYGISSFGLSERLTIGRKEAKELIDGYFASYPGVKTYMEESIRKAREKGYVTTMYGRRRYLRDIHSRNQVVRGNAERNAINAPIQGSAADVIKIAMVRIHEKLRAGNYRSKMILQVHDELIFEAELAELEKLKEMVIFEMSNAARLVVPLKVDWGTGKNWLEAH